MSNTQLSILRAKWEPGDLLAFIIPCLIFAEVKLVGRLFLPEVVLLVLFPFLLRHRGRILWMGPPKTVIVLGLFWLSGQIVTDVIRSIPFEDFSRGWSNIGIFLLEFSVIYLLVIKSERRVLLFALGVVIGQLLQFIIAPNVFAADGEVWKFGVGYAITFLLVLSSQLRLANRIPYHSAAILLAASALNFVMENRSLGGICFVASLYLFLQSRNKASNQIIPKEVSTARLFAAAIVLLIIGSGVLKLYGSIASSGLIGESAQQKMELQGDGELGLLIGGRQELLVSTMAILDSPIIGHGSWAKDTIYLDMLPDLLQKLGYTNARPISYDTEHIPTHSFLFGAWVNAGFLGALFWLYVMTFCFKLLLMTYRTNEPLSPVVAFIGFNMLWNILFSPFGAETRLYTAFYLVLLMLVSRKLLIKRSAQLPKRPH